MNLNFHQLSQSITHSSWSNRTTVYVTRWNILCTTKTTNTLQNLAKFQGNIFNKINKEQTRTQTHNLRATNIIPILNINHSTSLMIINDQQLIVQTTSTIKVKQITWRLQIEHSTNNPHELYIYYNKSPLNKLY